MNVRFMSKHGILSHPISAKRTDFGNEKDFGQFYSHAYVNIHGKFERTEVNQIHFKW